MRPVYYDVTHLRQHAQRDIDSGIRRVDLEYATHFLLHRPEAQAVVYKTGSPAVLGGNAGTAALIGRLRQRGAVPDGAAAAETSLTAILADGRRTPHRGATASGRGRDLAAYARLLAWPSAARRDALRRDAVYLNIAQHALAYGLFFDWLTVRRDVRGVFFVHDLLPLDYPEFWPRGYRDQFVKGLVTLATVGSAFLVSSEAIRDRLDEELRRRGRAGVPILASPFPAFRNVDGPDRRPAPTVSGEPYFVMVGTIEPRKNHLLVLNVWRRLAEAGGPVPKLVVVGRRGWENEQVVDMLERCQAIQGHVVEAPPLSDLGMARLVAHARALLFPSFAEGFGLPLTEALCAGTPVIASDLRVLRETAQDKAILLDPTDGPSWRAAIQELCDPQSALSQRARALAAAFRPVGIDHHFARLEQFIEGL